MNLKDLVMNFNELSINQTILSAIEDLQYKSTTDIQERTIPLLLAHDGDFVGQAQTGTGKTAAFVIPLLEKIDAKSKTIQALILTPTRELAQQVNLEVEKLAKYSKIRTAVIFGGVSYTNQVREIRRNHPNLIVGTPGRILDLLSKGVLDFKQTKKLVIDEADEMLNMGFLEDVQKIMASLAKQRNIWLFSATVPNRIQDLIKKNFKNIKEVRVQSKTLSNDSIDQYYCVLRKKHFMEGLKRVISAAKDPYAIVFCETKLETKALAEELNDSGLPVVTLHGDLNQSERDDSMAKFRSRHANILVCTDVAARGLDVKNITHVINFGLPRNPESYVHRIGRTGRAGTLGTAISFIAPAQRAQAKRIEKTTRTEIKPLKLPGVKVIKLKKVESELEKLESIREKILAKGDEFSIDDTFTVFEHFMKDLSREQALKLLFTMKFNKDFLKMSQFGELETPENFERSRPRSGSKAGGKSGRRISFRGDKGSPKSSSKKRSFSSKKFGGEKKRGQKARAR